MIGSQLICKKVYPKPAHFWKLWLESMGPETTAEAEKSLKALAFLLRPNAVVVSGLLVERNLDVVLRAPEASVIL